MVSKSQELIRSNALVLFFPLAIGISWLIAVPLAIAAASKADRPIIPFSMHYLVAFWHGAFNFISGSQAGEGSIAAILSTAVMVWAVVLVFLYMPADLSSAKRQVAETRSTEATLSAPALS